MPFEGSQIAVTVTHTIEPLAEVSIEDQIRLTEYLLSRQFAGNNDLLIRVEQVDVYSADYGSTKGVADLD